METWPELGAEIFEYVVHPVRTGCLDIPGQLNLDPSYQRAVLSDEYERAVEFCHCEIDAIRGVYISFATQSKSLRPAILLDP